ncbi:MAG: TIGR00153 family protein [Proteobacteria bacterium]|nr:TIGR00153 family protein [Pseudomonadota bacterium]NOG60971.1 TIGR00153 family protein [Pseudomonadota bacterium]
MRNIINVFGRSPFVPLQMHMEKVDECVEQIPVIIEAYRLGDSKKVDSIAEKISKLEHHADQIKHDIRNNLPRGMFMPVDRTKILKILSLQDGIANRAEDATVLLTFKQAKTFEGFDAAFDLFMSNCLETFQLARSIIDLLDELLETGFGGLEADRVNELIDKVALKEHEADLSQKELVRLLFAHEENISYGDFFLWTRVIQQISGIADRADKLAATIRNILE